MAKVKLEYYGVEGEGRNVTEAKRDAGEKIKRALDGSYSPELIRWRGESALLWREPMSGWVYRIVESAGEIREPGRLYSCGGGGDGSDANRRDVAADVLVHLAQNGWNHSDGAVVPEVVAQHKRAGLREWMLFQLRYKWAKAHGADDNQAHQWGGPIALADGPEIPPMPDDYRGEPVGGA